MDTREDFRKLSRSNTDSIPWTAKVSNVEVLKRIVTTSNFLDAVMSQNYGHMDLACDIHRGDYKQECTPTIAHMEGRKGLAA